jgi:hypothetical protein
MFSWLGNVKPSLLRACNQAPSKRKKVVQPLLYLTQALLVRGYLNRKAHCYNEPVTTVECTYFTDVVKTDVYRSYTISDVAFWDFGTQRPKSGGTFWKWFQTPGAAPSPTSTQAASPAPDYSNMVCGLDGKCTTVSNPNGMRFWRKRKTVQIVWKHFICALNQILSLDCFEVLCFMMIHISGMSTGSSSTVANSWSKWLGYGTK